MAVGDGRREIGVGKSEARRPNEGRRALEMPGKGVYVESGKAGKPVRRRAAGEIFIFL
jgi:hypothetical protein